LIAYDEAVGGRLLLPLMITFAFLIDDCRHAAGVTTFSRYFF